MNSEIKKYLIADTVFEVEACDSFSDIEQSPFLFSDNYSLADMPCVKIKSSVDCSIKFKHKDSELIGIIGHKTSNGNIIYLYDCEGNVAHLIEASSNWRNISVLSALPQKIPFEGSVGEVIFRTAILFNNGIVVHASAIEHQGKGIIFSAPSGTGKSTHADLWKKHKGAKILNGDRPAIRINNGNVDLYGTPWSGTSKEFLNKKVPLSAIVMLEQSPINEIRKLSSQEAVQLIVPRCFISYYDEKLVTLALDNIGNVINKIPVYLLKCRPDYDAVELVLKCLK